MFVFSIDGIQCPSVTDVTGLKVEVDKVEIKSNTKDGKYIVSQQPGRMKPGEITVTRTLDGDKSMLGWFQQALAGQITSARHTGKVEIQSTMGTTVRTFNFQDIWCVSLETNEYKAGGTDAMTEKAVMTYASATVT